MKKERTFSHALSDSPTKGLNRYMKRKCAQLDAPPLTCCLFSRYWSYFPKAACSVDATLLCGRGWARSQFQTYGSGVSITRFARQGIVYQNRRDFGAAVLLKTYISTSTAFGMILTGFRGGALYLRDFFGRSCFGRNSFICTAYSSNVRNGQ